MTFRLSCVDEVICEMNSRGLSRCGVPMETESSRIPAAVECLQTVFDSFDEFF